MAGVLVFGDTADSQLTAAAREVAAAGAVLAESFGQPLVGALIGTDPTTAAAQFGAGCSSLYLVEGKHYRPYTAQAYVDAAQAVIKACSPSVVLFPHTLETREWVPRLAAHLEAGLVMDCIAFAPEGSELIVTKPVYGGGVWGEFVIRGNPRMATIRAGIFAPLTSDTTAAVVRLDVPAPMPGPVTLLEEVIGVASGGPKLKDAKIVVSGGRGVGGPENWHFVEKTAAALSAAIGCSRPVADSGWVPTSQQIGLSGTCLSADLYIAIGISGAVQHLAGISAAKNVVAINLDPEAEIFTRANYGVVGDYKEVLPAFIEQIELLKD